MELNGIWRGMWCSLAVEKLLEKEIPETTRPVLNAILHSDHKHQKTWSPIYVIWHKHSARISVVWLKSSLGKYSLGHIKYPCRWYFFFCCILPLTSHNVLCHDDRENTVHKALQRAFTKKKNHSQKQHCRKVWFQILRQPEPVHGSYTLNLEFYWHCPTAYFTLTGI